MPGQSHDNQRSRGASLIPTAQFVFACSGQIASGKSTVMINLLTEKDKFFQKFHRIILISPTIELDEKMSIISNCPDICVSNQKLQDAIDDEIEQGLDQDEDHMRTKLPKYHPIEEEDKYEFYNPQTIQDIIDLQKYIIKAYGKEAADEVLFVIDDSPSLGIFRKSHSDIFSKFCTILRHYKCSVLFALQHWKCCPKMIRNQCTAGVFFDTNEVEKKEIFETFSINMPYRKWEEYFNLLTNVPYSHVTFNLKNPKGQKMIKEFSEYIA